MKKFTLQKTCRINFILLDDIARTFQIMEYDLSFTMYTGVDSMQESKILEAQRQQNTSFAKAMTFIEGVLNNSVMFVLYDNNFDVDHLFKGIENNFVAVPDPGENTLCALIHAKLNTIAGKDTIIDYVTLKDLKENMTYEYINDMNVESDLDEIYGELPSTREWVNELSYWKTPWWLRNDISTADKVAQSQEEYDDWQSKFEEVEKLNTETFQDIEKEINEAWKKVSGPKGSGELITVDFLKKKIEPKKV